MSVARLFFEEKLFYCEVRLGNSQWQLQTGWHRRGSRRFSPGMGFFSDWIPSSTFLMALGVRWISSQRKTVPKTVDEKPSSATSFLTGVETKISIVVIRGVIFSPRILFACLHETWDRDTYIHSEFLKLRRIRVSHKLKYLNRCKIK